MEQIFNSKLQKDRSSVNRLITSLSKKQYNIIVSKILAAKSNLKCKSACEFTLLQKYDVEDGTQKLIVPSTNSKKLYYVHDEELFEILNRTHLSSNHGDRDQMMKRLEERYKNVTYKDIMIFLNSCPFCLKRKRRKPTAIDKRNAEFNKRCLIDLIDYHSHPDGDFRFILAYQELYTKFCLLKPLKSCRPEEVADSLLNIFGILGPPRYLQSNVGGKFLNQVIDMLKILWCPLDVELSEADKPHESCVQEVESMVTSWMRNNNRSRWSEGIRFVQLKKNTTVNAKIGKTPYEALFKYSVKGGGVEDDGVREVEAVCKGEPDGEEEYDVRQEVMEIVKTEPKTVCGNCGFEAHDDEDCQRCNFPVKC